MCFVPSGWRSAISVASSMPFSATRASPEATSCRNASASGSSVTFSLPSPCSVSVSARRTTCATSSSESGWSVRTRVRERSAEMTSNDGFSVVAPMNVTVPFSTWGRMASCWALLKRCTSSTKRMVPRSSVARISRASSTACRRSATPEVTAETPMKWDFVSPATSACKRRLAGAGRAPEHHGGHLAGADGALQDVALAEEVALPDVLLERAGAHAGCERGVLVLVLSPHVFEERLFLPHAALCHTFRLHLERQWGVRTPPRDTSTSPAAPLSMTSSLSSPPS